MVAGIDLQPMAPIEGVIQVQGDITNARAAEVVRWIDRRIDKFFVIKLLLVLL